jgi:hypothetical protein
MLHALLLLAAAEAEPSKLPYYVIGGALALWAVVLSFLGLRSPEFPGSGGIARGVMAVSVALALATMASAVITARRSGGAPGRVAAGRAGYPKPSEPRSPPLPARVAQRATP